MTSIAFFDVDKTLVKGYSGYYAALLLIKKGILKKRRLLLALFYRLVSPLYRGNVEKLYEIAAYDMAGKTLGEILEIGKECFDRWVRDLIYVEGVQAIEAHKKNGDAVYLITSGPYMVIQILADFLKVDGFYSAGPLIDSEGRLTRKIKLPIYYQRGKLVAAQEVVQKYGISWENCYFYSDSIDDIPLLEKVGHPRMVNPDNGLLKIGQERGWPTLYYTQVLGG